MYIKYLTGQWVKTMENFLEFLLITFPLLCSQIHFPFRVSMRKYIVCTSVLSITANTHV